MADNVSLKIWNAIEPLVNRQIEEQTRNCQRVNSMTVSTAYSAQTGVVGVREAFGKEIFLPVISTIDTGKLIVGANVWVSMPYSSMSNAIVTMMGDGNNGEPYVELEGVVRYDKAQALNETQTAQARTNINVPEKAKEYAVSLTAEGWTGDSAPYTQTVTVTGLAADAHLIVGLAPTVTAEEMEVAASAMLLATGQAEGSIIISAFGDKPGTVLPILIMEVG